MLDSRQNAALFGPGDGDNIESWLPIFGRIAGAFEKKRGGAGDSLLLLAIDSLPWCAVLGRGARFHFNKDQRLAFACDHVDFAVGAPKRMGENCVTLRTKETTSGALALRAKSK